MALSLYPAPKPAGSRCGLRRVTACARSARPGRRPTSRTSGPSPDRPCRPRAVPNRTAALPSRRSTGPTAPRRRQSSRGPRRRQGRRPRPRACQRPRVLRSPAASADMTSRATLLLAFTSSVSLPLRRRRGSTPSWSSTPICSQRLRRQRRGELHDGLRQPLWQAGGRPGRRFSGWCSSAALLLLQATPGCSAFPEPGARRRVLRSRSPCPA